jgi:flagellar basal-body rod modification protein FlgD
MTISTTSLSNQLSRDLATKRPEGKPPTDESRTGVPDFQNLIQDSNQAFKEEAAKKKATMGEGGELKLGETKDDKSFREMLERVSGQPQRKNKNALEKEDFLNLMVTQLKYQDPTKPQDHQDMAAQLAQFNTVEQLAQANRSLENMSKSQDELKSDKLTEYLGKEVTAAGDKIRLLGDSSPVPQTSGQFNLEVEAGSVSVTIKNDRNEVVKTISLGNVKAGDHAVAWDGTDSKGQKLGQGVYTFDVAAQSVDGKKLNVSKQITAEVTGVSQLGKGGQLETALGEVKAKEIVAIRKPGSAPALAAPTVKAEDPAPQTQKPAEKTNASPNLNLERMIKQAVPERATAEKSIPNKIPAATQKLKELNQEHTQEKTQTNKQV